MNRNLPALVLSAILAGSILSEATYAQGPEGGEAGASAEKPAPRPRPRWQAPLKLPEQYRAKDKDKDGQIGLYEWDRKDFATFRKLDLNHDGYLTAEELTRKPSSVSSRSSPPAAVARVESVARPAAPSTTIETSNAAESPAPSTATGAGGSTADKPAAPAGDVPATATETASGAGRSEADRQWEEVLDKDKDGKVTEAEWGKSILMKIKFEKAGINVTFPMSRDEFVRLYSQLPGAGK